MTTRSETQFTLVIYRTQLFDPADTKNVKKVRAGYKIAPLSAFLGQPTPPAAPAVDWPKFEQSAFTTPSPATMRTESPSTGASTATR